MNNIEYLFEKFLWNSRLIVLTAVIASLAASLALFYMTSVDVFYLILHVTHYGDASLTTDAREILRAETVAHVVAAVDGYLLATVMLIFALGLYELFISKIDAAAGDHASSSVLFIRNLDDLKDRLAKVVLMILVVTFFERSVRMSFTGPLDLLYFAIGIMLVSLALYFAHKGSGTHLPENRTESH